MKYYSKRELYALGETLGDSVTEHKVGGRIYGGGGKGGGGSAPAPAPAPSSQSVSNTSIPEYARPYVENMLGQAQALTAQPYQTYGGQRIAEFSPLQQQAFSNVASQTTASQLEPATGLATASGLGSLGISAEMAGAGDRYGRMATDPRAMSAYMSPYIQASLQPQLNLLAQQTGIQGAQQQSAATQAGAFGGSRSALQNALVQQAGNLAQQQAIGQGYQTAFDKAQQAQQFGANLGLQGYQGALSGLGQAGQAGATLGQLGQTQFGQQQAINQAQQTTGAVQQAQAQQALDQAYQDFMKQRNYPYTQLAFMSDMLRGLPLSQSAQSVYNAPPNMASQLGGLGMAGLGIYGMSGGFRAKGGMVGKGYANGGLMAAKTYKEGGYADGGQPMAGEDVIKQLMEMLNNPELTPQEVEAIEKKIISYRRMMNNPQSDEIMAPAVARAGIGSIATGDMVPEEGMAGGGIVAFAQGGLKRPETEMDYTDLIKQRLAAMDTGNPFAKSEEQTQAIRQAMEERKRISPFEAMTMAGLATMAGTSQYGLENVGKGGMEGLKTYSKSAAENAADQKLLLQQQVEAEKGKYARDTGNLNALIAAQSAKDTKALGLLNAKNTAAATAASQEYNNFLKASAIYSNAVTAEKRNLFKANKDKFNYDVDNAELDMEARANVAKTMPKIAAIVGGGAPINPEIDAPDPKAKPGAKTDTSSALPLPSKKDALVTGKTYNTSKGPAKWDGTQFIPI